MAACRSTKRSTHARPGMHMQQCSAVPLMIHRLQRPDVCTDCRNFCLLFPSLSRLLSAKTSSRNRTITQVSWTLHPHCKLAWAGAGACKNGKKYKDGCQSRLASRTNRGVWDRQKRRSILGNRPENHQAGLEGGYTGRNLCAPFLGLTSGSVGVLMGPPGWWGPETRPCYKNRWAGGRCLRGGKGEKQKCKVFTPTNEKNGRKQKETEQITTRKHIGPRW